MKFNIILVLMLTVTGCATREAQIQTAISLTRDHFKNTAILKDDSLDTTATITTVNGFQEKHGLLGIVWDDNFLRAFIDKKTGKATIQVYQIINYEAHDWNFYQTVNYETPSGPVSESATIIDRNVNCSNSTALHGCEYREQVAFDIDEKLLRAIASNYQPGQRAAWRFKFTAKSGIEYNDGILPAEIGGLLDAIDGYRVRNGLAKSSG